MRQVVWTDEARSEFRREITRIAADSPAAARLVRQRIERTVELLAERPIGHPGRVKDTYEKRALRTPYILAYALSDLAVTILHVVHTSREWLEGEWPEER